MQGSCTTRSKVQLQAPTWLFQAGKHSVRGEKAAGRRSCISLANHELRANFIQRFTAPSRTQPALRACKKTPDQVRFVWFEVSSRAAFKCFSSQQLFQSVLEVKRGNKTTPHKTHT